MHSPAARWFAQHILEEPCWLQYSHQVEKKGKHPLNFLNVSFAHAITTCDAILSYVFRTGFFFFFINIHILCFFFF